MKLDSIVPWGRSFEEYRSMFGLTEHDLTKRILGCGDGPASFNAELTQHGGQVISADPIYQFSGQQIQERIEEVYPHIMDQMRENASHYLWETTKDVDTLGDIRMAAMTRFLADYQQGQQHGRYRHAALPSLPFDDHQFDLAVCSHFLFLYSEHFTLEEHILSMKELCRIAREVRVYPLLSLDGSPSQHTEAVCSALNESGIQTSFQPVHYQFQKGANEMLVATSSATLES